MIAPLRFFDALGWTSSRHSNKIERILVLGPSITDPIQSLRIIYPLAELVLVEIDSEALQHLESRFRNVDHIRLVEGDGSHLVETAPGPYDLAIIRHPDVARFTGRWTAALSAAASTLRRSARLMVTCYSLPEAIFVNEVLSDKSMTLVPGSPYTSTPVDLQGNDRFILIFER